MNIEKMIKDAYMCGVTEAQVAEQIPNMSFDFEGMANAYAKSEVNKNIKQQSKQLSCIGCKYNGGDDSLCGECGDDYSNYTA